MHIQIQVQYIILQTHFGPFWKTLGMQSQANNDKNQNLFLHFNMLVYIIKTSNWTLDKNSVSNFECCAPEILLHGLLKLQ